MGIFGRRSEKGWKKVPILEVFPNLGNLLLELGPFGTTGPSVSSFPTQLNFRTVEGLVPQLEREVSLFVEYPVQLRRFLDVVEHKRYTNDN